MGKKGFNMSWAPAPAKPLPTLFSGRGSALSQQAQTLPKLEHDNKITSIALDAIVGLGAGYLASLYSRANARESTFWWVVTGISTVKLLHDLSRP